MDVLAVFTKNLQISNLNKNLSRGTRIVSCGQVDGKL